MFVRAGRERDRHPRLRGDRHAARRRLPEPAVLRVRLVILARHGESEYSARGLVNGDHAVSVPLTERGREEARELGRAVADDPINLCVTSEFARTQETADLALAGREVPRLVLPELNDPDYGSFEGGLLDDYRTWARAHSSNEAPPGGESRQEIVARYVSGFETVLSRTEETILVAGHSLPVAYVVGGGDIAPVVPLVGHAEPHRLTADKLKEVVDRMRAWLAAPTW